MANSFVHVELNTGDVESAKGFYSQLFDWKLEDMPMGPGMVYTMLGVGKGVGGGMQTKPMPEAPTMWLPYVEVKDVRATIDRARGAGATIHVEHMEVPGMGALGIFTDPTGASLGVWQPYPKARAAAAGGGKKKAAKKKAAKKPAKKAKGKKRR
jgi:predicted enzyme related to lactoylglutathione lyase